MKFIFEIFFWACPFAALRVGELRATLSLRCYAALRTADAPSACLTQKPLQVGRVCLFKT
ncbi:MAG: hypothetical protein NZ519_07770 [Bacteroidia bacterium]|nr:hypothetical protein [Bacteroidia bacterium]MDW8346327.1 hypothetical protein [Bacteroidia bacterium]